MDGLVDAKLTIGRTRDRMRGDLTERSTDVLEKFSQPETPAKPGENAERG